jgi:hypothetical protein
MMKQQRQINELPATDPFETAQLIEPDNIRYYIPSSTGYLPSENNEIWVKFEAKTPKTSSMVITYVETAVYYSATLYDANREVKQSSNGRITGGTLVVAPSSKPAGWYYLNVKFFTDVDQTIPQNINYRLFFQEWFN